MNKPFIIISLFLLVNISGAFQKIGYAELRLKPFDEAENLSLYLEEVYQSALDRGVRNFIPFSILLTAETRKALQKKDYETALVLSGYAEKLSPDFYPAGQTAAASRWKAKEGSVTDLLQAYINIIVQKTGDFNYMTSATARTTAMLVLCAVAVLLVLCILFLVKYGALLLHDFTHLFPPDLSARLLKLFLAAVFLLPLLLNLSFFWGVLFTSLLLLAYQTKREKTATLFAFCLCMMLPGLVWCLSVALHAEQNQVVRSVWNINYGYWTGQDIETLETHLQDSPEDATALFTLALGYKKEGRYSRAVSYYSRAAEMRTPDFRALTNLGNVYYALGRWQTAIETYREAVQVDPERSAAAQFNLSRAYRRMFRFEDAEKAFFEAMELDGARVDRYIDIYSENINRLLIDETVSRRDIIRQAHSMFLDEKVYAANVWDFLFSGVPYGQAVPVLAVLILAGFFILLKDRFRIAVRCYMCGNTMCRRCEPGKTADLLCSQCSRVLKTAAVMEQSMKKEKIAQILRYHTVDDALARFFCIVLPGTGDIWKGKALQGTVVLALFFMLLSYLVLGFCFKPAVEIPGTGITAGFWINLCLIVLLWGFAARKSLKFSPPGHERLLLNKIAAMAKE